MRDGLKIIREDRGLTQGQVVTSIGCSIRMYRFIEAGQREGKGWIWDALQDLFGVNQRELRATTVDPACSFGIYVKTEVPLPAQL